MNKMFYEYLLVFLGGAMPWLEIALVIPVGIVSGLSPTGVIISAFLGNLSTVFFVVLGFEKVKEFYESRKKADNKKESKRTERGTRIWNRYGMGGLALLGPILLGTHIAVFIGLLFGVKKKNAILWMTFSIALWSLIFGVVTAMGFDFFLVNK